MFHFSLDTADDFIDGLLWFLVSCGVLVAPISAQEPGQTIFSSPDESGRALFSASQSGDDSALLAILGPAAKDVISSGDTVEDEQGRSQFVTKYQQMHRFSKQSNGTLVLVVGAENRPFPVPLVHGTAGWYFDTRAGKDEVLFRRIGENETAAILAFGELVDGQRQYFVNGTGGSTKQYAQRLVSDPGTRNGLYWEKAPGVPGSPFDSRIAHAGAGAPSDRAPFFGYFFRVLTQQGPQASGGAKDYIVAGKMTGGFACRIRFPLS